ncbi:MAG: hypothetical protein JST07_00460 [Bacteroidetes bacterium]|nr:hypothetical protein [Bacteroidota bacterium]
MKAKLNLTVEDTVLQQIKGYAQKQHTSVSELVENYFKKVTKPTKKKNLITIIEKLDKPIIKEETDLKSLYYQSKLRKNGF